MKNNIYFNNASTNNFLIWIISFLVYPFSKFFFFIGISANLLTLFSVIFTFLAFYFLITDQYTFFLFFWLLNIFLDFCDGQVARISKNVNKSSLRIDQFSDIFKICLIFLGTAIYFKDEGFWILIFITNFFFLFYIILNCNNKKKINLKKKKKYDYFFFNYYKKNSIFIATIKVLIPVILQFNGHSLLLFALLPYNKFFFLIIIIYMNLIFIYQIFKTIKKLIHIKKT